jgi:hypothetical protein
MGKVKMRRCTFGKVESLDLDAVARTWSWCPGRCPDNFLRPSDAAAAGEEHSADLLRRRYFIVVPRPLPAAPLTVRRTYLIVVLRSVLRPLHAATRRCRIRRKSHGI